MTVQFILAVTKIIVKMVKSIHGSHELHWNLRLFDNFPRLGCFTTVSLDTFNWELAWAKCRQTDIKHKVRYANSYRKAILISYVFI